MILTEEMKKNLPLITEEELKEISMPTEQLIEMAIKDFDEQLKLDNINDRNNYVATVDIYARSAYILLGKLFLYGNTTNDANKWVDEIVDTFTVPMMIAKTRISPKARAQALCKGYIYNFFGENFEDYSEEMHNFCEVSIREIEKDISQNTHPLPHRNINEAITLGFNVIKAFADAIIDLSNGTTQQNAYNVLEKVLRTSLNTEFELQLNIVE